MKLVAIPFLSVLFAAVNSCQSQRPGPKSPAVWADSSVPGIMALAGKGFPDGIIVDVLRQKGRPQPGGKRDELGDSVVALAIRTPSAISAVGAIISAGRPTDHARRGTPEARALDWLIRIHQGSPDAGTRGAALDGMLLQVQPPRALSYLRLVAVSPTDPTAWLALSKLISFVISEELGSAVERAQTLSQLREMWDQRLVTNQLALVLFERFAAAQKWPRHRNGAGRSLK